MTDELNLGAIKARRAAITPGVWSLRNVGEHGDAEIYAGDAWIAEPHFHNDAEFITNAPADIKTLLRRIEKLEAALSFVVHRTKEPLSEALRHEVWETAKFAMEGGENSPAPTAETLEAFQGLSDAGVWTQAKWERKNLED